MKIEKSHKIGFFDIDHNLQLRIQSVARLFQEIAVLHSTKVGAGPDTLFDKSVIWLLYRLEVEFFRYPVLDDNIMITTWSRAFQSYKAFREFHIQSPKADIARGSSVWILFDFKRKKLTKVPFELSSCYEIENEKWFYKEINDWNACGRINPEQKIDISLRYSDFDMNGHVNNTIYLEFLETLYHKIIDQDGTKPIKNFKIRFNREISRDKESIQVGFYKKNGLYQCNVFDDSTLFADAEITPMD